MAKIASQLPFAIGCFLLCLFIYFFYAEIGNNSNKDTGVSGRGNNYRWTSIADVFVGLGRRYKENDGVIFNCLSGDVMGTVQRVKSIRNFTTVLTETGLEDAQRQAAFQQIFEGRAWMTNQDKAVVQDKMSPEYKASGSGSSLKAGQKPLALLNSLIDRLKIYLNKPVITIVDIPCGDFYWMRELVGQRSDVDYTGIDIVPTLIDRHTKNYINMKNAHFMHVDIVKSRLNKSYDIIFSRDMLQHLKNSDVMRVLDHFSTSGSKLLVTTQLTSTENTDITAHGGFRNLNLMLPPVSLVPPVCIMLDTLPPNTVKHLGAWTLPLKQRGDI